MRPHTADSDRHSTLRPRVRQWQGLQNNTVHYLQVRDDADAFSTMRPVLSRLLLPSRANAGISRVIPDTDLSSYFYVFPQFAFKISSSISATPRSQLPIVSGVIGLLELLRRH